MGEVKPIDFGPYTGVQRLGSGTFGDVWEVKKGEQRYAAKLESLSADFPLLHNERDVMEKVQPKCPENIPKIYHFQKTSKYSMMIMDLLGKSLETLHTELGTLKPTDVAKLAIQMIRAIKIVHNEGYIHRDIKPDNFVMGRNTNNQSNVFLIDFGLAKQYIYNGVHIPQIMHSSLTGTARYASTNALRYSEQSRRDDMESLYYVWAYLLNPKLPWQGVGGNGKQLYKEILKLKLEHDPEKSFPNLPKCFVKYWKDVLKLDFMKEPPYDQYIEMIKDEFPDLDKIKLSWDESSYPVVQKPKNVTGLKLDAKRPWKVFNKPKSVSIHDFQGRNMSNITIVGSDYPGMPNCEKTSQHFPFHYQTEGVFAFGEGMPSYASYYEQIPDGLPQMEYFFSFIPPCYLTGAKCAPE